MNRKFPYRLAVICLATLSAGALADIVTLKNGTKIEGKITTETDSEITLTVKTGGVIDEQTVKKSDVASVAKDAPDEVAWQSLKNLKLGKNSLPVASYDSVINPLKGFATEYPKSQFAAEAQKIADTFATEKKRVEAGEVKLDDKWLSKDEAQKERYQIGGLVAFNYMKEQSARDMTAALNTFDAIEKNFPGSRAYPDAAEYAQKMLPALKAEVERRTKAFAAQNTEQSEALKKMTGPEKVKLEDEQKRMKAAAEAAVSAAEKQGNKWLPLSPATEKSLQSLTSRISSETTRISALPVAKMRASLRSAETAKAALDKKQEGYLAEAEAALTQASNDWPNNELVTRLREEVKSAKAIAAATPPPVLDPLATAAPTGAATKSAESEPAPAAEPEHEKPFLLTPGGAVSVVIAIGVLIAGFSAFKKIKAKASDVLE